MDQPEARWRHTTLSGVQRRRTVVQADERGSFAEIWRDSWTGQLTTERFVQANLSRSLPGVLRGLHVHRRQADLWTVIEGVGKAALVDLRPLVAGGPGAPNVPVHEMFDLEPGDQLFIPHLVGHGFYARSELVLSYFVTREYDSTDELGFAWDDPQVAVPWPDREPILSSRDRDNPRLKDLLPRIAPDARSD